MEKTGEKFSTNLNPASVLGAFRDPDGQNAIVEIRIHTIGVDGFMELKRTGKPPMTPLDTMVLLAGQASG